MALSSTTIFRKVLRQNISQYKFYKSLLENDSQNEYIRKLITIAIRHNIGYIRHYKQLITHFSSPYSVKRSMQIKYKDEWCQKIINSHAEDPDSKLGTYYTINPTLVVPVKIANIMEHERMILTRFRTGSHNLRIETGRWCKEQRDQRVCQCETDVQTVKHFFMDCPLLAYLRDQNHTSVSECLESENIINYIVCSAKVLKLEL